MADHDAAVRDVLTALGVAFERLDVDAVVDVCTSDVGFWSSTASVGRVIWPRFSGVWILESGGVLGVEVSVFVFGWCEHAKGRVAAGVVAALDVPEDPHPGVLSGGEAFAA